MSRISTQPLADQPLGALPSTNDRRPQPLHWPPVSAGRQVHTFHTRARTKLAPPPCRTPPGQSAGSRQAHPGPVLQTQFRRHLSGFDTSSVDRLRSPSWPTPDALDGAPCPQRSPPRLLTAAACGGLRPPPAGRSRRTTSPEGRPLHLRCSTASISPIFYIEPPCCVSCSHEDRPPSRLARPPRSTGRSCHLCRELSRKASRSWVVVETACWRACRWVVRRSGSPGSQRPQFRPLRWRSGGGRAW